MTNTKKPHVHAEVIKAWADGAEIEYRHEDCHMWRVADNPTWNLYNRYRVKPEPVVKYHGILQGVNGYENMNHTTGYHSELKHVSSVHNQWKLIAIVKTTFVDRVPVAVEILK